MLCYYELQCVHYVASMFSLYKGQTGSSFVGQSIKNVGVIVRVEHDLLVIGCIKDIYLINNTEVFFSVKLHHTY